MTILLALLLDRLFGEPPAHWHPVVWMGTYLARVGRRLPDLPPQAALVAGALAWCSGAVLVLVPAVVAAWVLRHMPVVLAIPVGALLLKPLFSLHLLLNEVAGVEAALAEGLDAGRARLGRIVSRDTSSLSAEQVRESALESLSENLSDSLVAPLFWYTLLGLPGAALYRFANTADAMWGYHGRWEWAGKWAARADDLLNLIPARLTALALLGLPRPGALTALRQEAERTTSPNSGWPMAALALALGVRLGKPGVYLLNAAAPSPTAAQVQSALMRAQLAGLALALLAAGLELAHG